MPMTEQPMQHANETPDTAAERKRGSALVIALGAIALIAVLAAVYVTIGQGDQRVAESVERVEERTNVEQEFSDYLLGVVGRDRLDTYLEPMIAFRNGNQPIITQRIVRFSRDRRDGREHRDARHAEPRRGDAAVRGARGTAAFYAERPAHRARGGRWATAQRGGRPAPDG
jgi:hypothetical protein